MIRLTELSWELSELLLIKFLKIILAGKKYFIKIIIYYYAFNLKSKNYI